MTDVPTRLASALTGRYRIERELGQGGMATVYLAQDIRHDRKVALKVLKPELAAIIGAERFLQEIKTTANLQHPHILGLIDSGEADGLLWYVMPFVEGESLRDRLTRERQLPIEDAVRLTTEVAGALDYAHRRGVIHRDIKPENILLHDKRALVADFGIALAVSSAGSSRMTQTGMSLGTPQYMSPEQAMGERSLDARSDVYSLGAMLYEMLAGDPPYTGSSAQAIVAKVLTEKPPLVTAARDTVPPHIAGAVNQALAKLPADRFQSAAEFGAALEWPAGREVGRTGRWSTVQRPDAPASRLPVLLGVGLAAALAGLALGWGLHRAPAVGSFPVTFTLEADSSHSYELNRTRSLSVSEDGTRIAYLGRTAQGVVKVFERRLGEPVARALAGTDGADHPFYSPDGQWMAFDSDGMLKKVATGGGAPIVLARIGGATTSGAWGTRGIVYSAGVRRPLFLIPADGGTPVQLTTPDSAAGESQLWPAFLPGGNAVVFTNSRVGENGLTVQLGVLDLESHRVKLLDVRALAPHYLSSGELLYGLEDGSLVQQPFDPDKQEFTGTASRVAEGIELVARVFPAYAASPAGVIAYYPSQSGGTLATLVDRSGTERILFSAPDLWSPRFSPSGDRIAYSRAGANPGGRDLWVYSLRDQTALRLTRDYNNAVDGSWSRDAKRLTFAGSGRAAPTDLYLLDADGSTPPVRVLEQPEGQYQPVFAAGGSELVYVDRGPGGDRLMRLPLGGTPAPQPLSSAGVSGASPAVSPDGRWLAFHSAESGQTEIYVRPFPGPGAQTIISSGGGAEPAWGSGHELFYRSGGTLVSATLGLEDGVSVLSRKLLFAAPYLRGRGNRNYDVAPDGSRFVFVKNTNPPRLVVRLNALAPEPR
jgi:eukaryotic-like serine/threonine-protein kinase